ncbi:hypothetical protein [Streptococcus suis]|uniref:hypothetical protein n=1 Tax=Streptococcus suis TaxID=1307 RepID=UPI00201A9990|nr:hypothetical protein [Streptococcus suis]MCL4940691.1 hypothetical protein [Streptococcus suis]
MALANADEWAGEGGGVTKIEVYAMSELSKVTIRISGKAMDESKGYELKYLLKSLDSFSKLSEKTYLHMISEDRLKKSESGNFALYIDNFQHGSFLADLVIVMNSYALPLLEHGQTIWGAITTVYDFIKTISSAKEEGKSVSIENVGDGSIAVAVSDSSSVGDITINNYLYPEYVRELSPKLAPSFSKLVHSIDENIDEISFNSSDGRGFKVSEKDIKIFDKKEFLSSEEIQISGTITVLNTHDNTGKIQIESNEIPLGEYKFDVQKQIRYPEYLSSAMRKKLRYRCYPKINFDPSTLKEKVIGVRIIEKL